MSYQLLRPLLFSLDAETAHRITLKSMSAFHRIGLLGLFSDLPPEDPVEVMGLQFRNRIGLAAGLDKDGEAIDALGALGFSFLELGTVTPKPQVGNPKPRLFRLPEYKAIINRMGFNNHGVDALTEKVKAAHYDGVKGINIGKNATTPLDEAEKDYLLCMERVYPYADYIAVNISSPNTVGLRELQQGGYLMKLLDAIVEKKEVLHAQNGKRNVPIAIKLAPDFAEDQLIETIKAINSYKLDGVIATNTTLSRESVSGSPLRDEKGGLSGAPLTHRSTEVIRLIRSELNQNIPIIGVGGIMSGADAKAKIDAGADLVQVYTGLIYGGPRLIGDIGRAIAHMNSNEF